MVQTRAEAAVLVVQLQRTAVTQGLLFYGVAAVTALSFMTAVIVWIAVAAPPPWRGWLLGILSVALLAAAIYSVLTAGKKIRRDASLIADFSRGIKLDLAMITLALKDPETEDEDKLAERERAKTKVREAAAEKVSTPSTAEGADAPSAANASVESAAAAMRAAAPGSPAAKSKAADADEPAGRPAGDAGYAFTAGGSYASTVGTPSSNGGLPEAVTEREVPEPALVRPLNPPANPADQDSERKQRHGSA
jgi:uncharacterized membrane protein YqjE